MFCVRGGGALLCNVTKKSPLPNSVRRKLYVFLTAIFLSLSCFGEVLHSYVTDNPNTQINKIETIKEREKAELNLSVTKVKSKELSGQIDESNKRIILTLPEEFQNKSLVVVEGLEDLPNPSTVQGRKVLSRVLNNKAVSNNLTQEIQGNNLIVSYKNKPEKLYVSDLNGNFYKWNNYFQKFQDNKPIKNISIKLKEVIFDYKRSFLDNPWQFERGEYITENYTKNVSIDFFATSQPHGSHRGNNGTHYGRIYVEVYEINGKTLIEKQDFIFWNYLGGDAKVTVNKSEFYKKTFNKLVKVKIRWDLDLGGYTAHIDGGRRNISVIKDIHIKMTHDDIKTLEGQSVLTVKEYYPVNQFINFNSTTMEEGSSLTLENSLRDVSLITSGEGIVKMEQGDTLEIDGKKSTIESGGNLAEQKAVIGNLEYTYKVENGKLRLALNKWGVLEPDKDISINLYRVEEGNENKIAEHTLTIKSPRRVEGSSDLTYDNDYQIRTFVRFGGISLTAPGISSLETPVPAGVALSSQAGQGIPFMEEGDILEVNDGVTRAVHQFTIGAGGTLSKKQIKFNNSDVTLYVENGKLRAGLNNWIVNKPVKLNLRLIRGTNEIMNHAIGFKVPEAPFNIKENGLLDFGRVTAGSKRTAETNIVLEMLNDVDSVKFNLKDTQPVMENANGKQLKVNEIQTIVKKQGEKTYLVKLHGKLIIPEDTQMGEYSGSTILELRIK